MMIADVFVVDDAGSRRRLHLTTTNRTLLPPMMTSRSSACLFILLFSWKLASAEYWIHFGHDLAVFTHTAITPQKVNWFGWNLEHSEYIVGGWAWQILGTVRGQFVRQAKFNFFPLYVTHDFANFPLAIFREISTQQRQLVRRWKLSKQNFENFTVRGCFFAKKCQHFPQNFNVLQLQAAIVAAQWLQIAGNSLPNDPSTDV